MFAGLPSWFVTISPGGGGDHPILIRAAGEHLPDEIEMCVTLK
jgi:hypothetical protein